MKQNLIFLYKFYTVYKTKRNNIKVIYQFNFLRILMFELAVLTDLTFTSLLLFLFLIFILFKLCDMFNIVRKRNITVITYSSVII